MNRFLSLRNVTLALGLAALTTPSFAAEDLDDSTDQSGWFIRLGGRISTGVKAQIRDTQVAPTPTAGVYNDGFVLPDAGGSSTLTQNWGYQNAGQVQGNNLVFHRLDSVPRVGDRTGLQDNPQYGGELVGGFEFVRFDLGKREARFGFELGYSYSQFSVTDHATAKGSSPFTVDGYPLDALVPGSPINPPGAPYAGSFIGSANSNNPLIGLNTSSHTVTSVAGTSTLNSRLESDFHTFRVGPWIEVPLSARVNLALSVGYATIYSAAHLTLDESVTYADPAAQAFAPVPISGRYLRSHWSPGAYAQLRATYRLTKHVGVYIGGDFQYNTGVTVTAPGREARFDFGKTYGAVVGVTYGF